MRFSRSATTTPSSASSCATRGESVGESRAIARSPTPTSPTTASPRTFGPSDWSARRRAPSRFEGARHGGGSSAIRRHLRDRRAGPGGGAGSALDPHLQPPPGRGGENRSGVEGKKSAAIVVAVAAGTSISNALDAGYLFDPNIPTHNPGFAFVNG